MKEFFGIGGYLREPEGYLSWQHLTFVTSLMIIMIGLAVFFGIKNKQKDFETKNKVLIWASILMVGFETIKILVTFLDARYEETVKGWWHGSLPLYLCSIQLIAIPLATFSRGKVKNAAMDFVFIFGLLGAVLGTYAAGQNYSSYPVLSFTNVVSGITHSISGFCALYIGISGMTSMKNKELPITFGILSLFFILAFVANKTLGTNYMFIVRGDGTPYDIVYNLVKGNKVLYPASVYLLFVIYIVLFRTIFMKCKNAKLTKANA